MGPVDGDRTPARAGSPLAASMMCTDHVTPQELSARESAILLEEQDRFSLALETREADSPEGSGIAGESPEVTPASVPTHCRLR